MNKLLFKKIFFIILMIPLVFLSLQRVNALEESKEYTITIEHNDNMRDFKNGQFSAYQLFKGRVNDDKDDQLSDIDWGEGVDGDEIAKELQNDEELKSYFDKVDKNTNQDDYITNTAEQVALVLQDHNNDATFLRKFSRIVKKHVKSDKKISSTLDEEDAVIKVQKPGYYIVIDEDNNTDSENNAISDFILEVLNDKQVNVKADIPTVKKEIVTGDSTTKGTTLNIGDTVNFKLTGTVADNYADYETYEYIFHDTLSKGLTLDETSIKITVGEKEITSDNYDSKVESNGGTSLTITFKDLKQIEEINKDSKIVVEYSATLNDEAIYGYSANTNTVYVEYSNDPNDKSKKGKTVTDIVNVYTFALDILKVDKDDETKKLEGAEFILYKNDGENKKYAKFKEVNETEDIKTRLFDGWVENKEDATKLTTDENGKISVAGLQAGTYFLEEIEAPIGYDTLKKDVEITIEAKINELGKLETISTTSVSPSTIKVEEDGTISLTIPNRYSTILPSTGGIGTIIFYVLGSVLLVGASGYLIYSKVKNK